MDPKTVILPVRLSSGKIIQVQVTDLHVEKGFLPETLSFEGITTAIEEISTAITESLSKAKPSKASVEFGLEVAVEAGRLTALLVKGSGTATLKITLEWGE